ncbi:MAG TPA: hypothetical protein VFK05_25635 [Polyangiaceae bacterium]|nr:hypothetical protein [Polyangiaceae bacterium]
MPKSVVWVLGAGFSAGLGAPVLNGLMSQHAIQEVKLRFAHKPDACTEAGEALVRAFARGERRGMWRDAEEFMDYIDTAARDDVRTAMMVKLVGQAFADDPSAQAAALKRFAAARCSLFLEGANLRSELWAPYLRWARALQPEDTVITFNWDVVLEKIAFHDSSQLQIAEARTGKFTLSPLSDESFKSDPPTGVVPVLKLHGSVGWLRRGNQYQTTPDPLFALGCLPEQSAIATPGPAKLGATAGFLEPLWKRAETALQAADAIVFLGYRCPPSDSPAREALLTAVSNPPGTGRAWRSIHTVLGPNLAHEDSARLKGLITGMLEGRRWHNFEKGSTYDRPLRFRLHQHPLFGQDFMSVFSRDWLFAADEVPA